MSFDSSSKEIKDFFDSEPTELDHKKLNTCIMKYTLEKARHERPSDIDDLLEELI